MRKSTLPLFALAGMLFGMLKNAQALMQSKQIPKEITFIIQGLIVVFIALRSGLKIYRQWLNKRRLQREVSAENKHESVGADGEEAGR